MYISACVYESGNWNQTPRSIGAPLALVPHADALATKGAKMTQTHIRETSYHSIKLHIKQMFPSV